MRKLILFLLIIIFLSGCVQEAPEIPGEKTDKQIPEIVEDEGREPVGFQIPDQFWESMNGPPGGRMISFFQDTSNPNEMYVSTQSGIYKTEDHAEQWYLFDRADDVGAVESMVMYDNKLFVCAGDGVFYYENKGQSVNIHSGYGACRSMALRGNNLLVSHRFYELEEPGKVWVADLSADRITFHDISPSISELNEVQIPSEDHGMGFHMEITDILPVGENEILINVLGNIGGDKNTIGWIYREENAHLYLSEDLGQSWRRISVDVPEDCIIHRIFQDPENMKHVVLVFKPYTGVGALQIRDMLMESFDGGRTWQRVPLTSDRMIWTIENVEFKDSAIYLMGDPGIYKIDGTGIEEVPLPSPSGSLHYQVWKLLFEPDTSAEDLAFALSEAGIFKSTDGMKTWEMTSHGLSLSSLSIVMPHPTDPKAIYTSGNTNNIPYFTKDLGKTWTPIFRQVFGEQDMGAIPYGDELKFDPHNQNHMIFITENTEVLDSFDAGETWTRVDKTFSSFNIIDMEVSDSTSRVYVSNLGVGLSFEEYENFEDPREFSYIPNSSDYSYDFELDPEDNAVVYASYSPKIFESHSSILKYSPGKEEGFGWEEMFRVEDSMGITSLEFDPSDPRTIYAGVIGEEGEIYVSNDKGVTWEKLNDDLTFTTIWGHSQLQIHPGDKDIVYAGTWGGGTYKTVNSGREWTKLDEDHTFSPTCLAVSNENNPDVVYACDRTAAKIHKSRDAGETWEEYYDFGKGNMMTSAVAIDPDDPDMIYASAFMPPVAHLGGFVRITGGEATPIGTELPRAVLEIEIDPNEKDTIYVTTHIHGVYKSTDGGITWHKLDDRNNGLPRIGVYDIKVDPTDSEIVYATALCGELPDYMINSPIILRTAGATQNLDPEGKCGVYKSTDGGSNWELKLETVSEARGIDIDPENHDNLYVADMMGGVWVSNDGGENWRQENTGLGSTSMTSVKVRGDYVYASTQGSGVYTGVIKEDGSITWERERSNKPKAEVYKIQIRIDPKDSSRIFASAYPGGMLRSDDGGKTWNDKNFLTPSIKVFDPFRQGYYNFDINPKNTDIVWMGVFGKGMFISYDGMDFDMFANGENNEMRGKSITSVKANPANPDEVYVGTQKGVFMTRDDGDTWEQINSGLGTTDIRSLEISRNGDVYAGTAGYGVYILKRGTKEWQHTGRPVPRGFWWPVWDRRIYQFSSILFDPDVPGKIYYGHFPSGFFISEDNGKTWKDSSLGLGNDGIFSLFVHPYNHSIIWAGTYNGVAKSIDKGKTWELKSKGMPAEQWPYVVVFDEDNPDIMYTTTKNGMNKAACEKNDFCGVVMKSTDGGENWFDIKEGLRSSSEFYNIIIYPENHDVLFLSSSHGVYLSTDAGDSWTPINNGLPASKNQVRDNVADNLALTPDHKYLILGLMGYGLWKADLSRLVIK